MGWKIPVEVSGEGRFVVPAREFVPAYLRAHEERRLREKIGEARWLVDLSRDIYVNVMDQYDPAWKVETDPKHREINRRLECDEIEGAYAYAREAGLWRLDKRWRRVLALARA